MHSVTGVIEFKISQTRIPLPVTFTELQLGCMLPGITAVNELLIHPNQHA